MKFKSLKPGMVVYDVHSYKMGNTTRTTMGLWQVRIVSVDPESQSVMASWNGNAPRQFSGRAIGKWRAKEPMMIRNGFHSRLATREEIKAAKEEPTEKVSA